jgi:hypothetical protein
MPTYTLKDIKTQKEHDITCSYSELQEILNAQPDLIKVLSTPSFVSSLKTHANSKTGDGWKDLLKRIDKGAGKHSKIKT